MDERHSLVLLRNLSGNAATVLLLIVLLACSGASAFADANVRESIVKIYTIHNTPDYFNPWAMLGPNSSTGSGCVIEGNRILTNAHVVSDQTFVQVRRYGQPKRYEARVLGVSHEADLALLEVEDAAFFEGSTGLTLGELPETQTDVVAYGFPLGGDTLSITKGVVSRIEHIPYTHSSSYLLAGQIDAAINPGNSGGPVLVDGRIVGVVMQSVNVQQAENIGYMVPVTVIKHYLKDLADGKHDGFPDLNLALETLENTDLRASYHVPADTTGVLVTRVVVNSPARGLLEAGDVITSVDGQVIADDGTVEFRPQERTSFMYLVQQHQLGEKLTLRFLRKGEAKDVTLTLTLPQRESWLVPMEHYDVMPSYYIYGGLVFTPLTKSLLKRWGPQWYDKAPKHLVAALRPNHLERIGEQKVLMLKVLASDLAEGYLDYRFWVVTAVNGKPILNLKELVERLDHDEQTEGRYASIEEEGGMHIVLDKAKVKSLGASILQTYRISVDRSADLAR